MVNRRDEEGSTLRRSPPWGLVGMIGLVMVIEWTIAGHDLDFTTPMQWDWRVMGKAATRPDRVAGKDLLVFGDSVLKFSLMPRVIQERSGVVAYNFALHTGQTSSSYFMLRRALKAGARPSAIVLDLTPHLLMNPPEINKSLWAELLSPLECFDLAWSHGNPDFFASTFLATVLTSFKERHEIRAGLLASIAGKSQSRRFEIPRYRRNWKINDGAQLFGNNPAPGISIDEWVNTLYAFWAPHPVNVVYLDRFLKLARSKEIPVYWLLPPNHPGLQDRLEAIGFDAHLNQFVSEVQSRYPEVTVLDARHSGFSADHFMDGVHVNRRGAMRLSTMVADATGGQPKRDRLDHWVSLKLGPDGVLDLPMEDVEQSARLLQSQSILAAETRGVIRR